MLLVLINVTKFMFHVQILELEKGLTKVKNELKSMKDEARKEEAKKKETTNDIVA
jgi:hypothetical protein